MIQLFPKILVELQCLGTVYRITLKCRDSIELGEKNIVSAHLESVFGLSIRSYCKTKQCNMAAPMDEDPHPLWI